VPLVAVLLAARAFAYELTVWLAVAWLVLHYTAEVRRGQPLLLGLLGLSALSAALTILSGGFGVPWGALSGLLLVAALVREYHAGPPMPTADSRPS
jgi:hypothetical protein